MTSYDATQAHTTNHLVGEAAEAAVDALLAEPFANWHVDTATETHQLRVTKKGVPLLHTSTRTDEVAPSRGHDRPKDRLLAEDDPVLVALGISDAQGRVKPTRQAKYRQVEEFLRLLDASLTEAVEQGRVRTPTADDPLRVVDLGCGNAYLTFAAHAYLSDRLPVRVTGVDVKQQSADHNARVAADLGIDADFVVGLDRRRTARAGARRRARPARLRHRDRRRPRPARWSGRPRWSWPPRAATTTSPPSSARPTCPSPTR